MEKPFYGSYWSQPARPRYSPNMRGGIPVQSIHQKPTGIKPPTKVVQIPVHFVSSDPDRSVSASDSVPDRSVSALRIQKVFRGFLVRKSVKRIMAIRREVDDIERKLLCRETSELISRDEKERLRVNEMLMALLFKLDSIRGVDSGVREFRKAVIKKAIFLQEIVDSIVVLEANQIADVEENQNNHYDETGDIPDSIEGKSTNQSVTFVEGEQHHVAPSVDKCEELQEESDCPIRECMEGSVESDEVGDVIEGIDDENETRSRGLVSGEEEESRRNRELLEIMVEKNDKMMSLVNELCQRNEVQTRMLTSLAQRVDQLEKTFVCDRLKKKKKKKRHPA